MDEEFRKKIIARRGDVGAMWLTNLPEIIKSYEKKWEIVVSKPFPLSYNYVAPAQTKNGKRVVIKISFPQNHEFKREVAALHFYRGNGAIRILREDTEKDVLLLEMAEPGTRLRDIKSDRKQIGITSQVMQEFQQPIMGKLSNDFPSVLDLAQAFTRYKNNTSGEKIAIPQKLVDRAEEIFFSYPKEQKEHVLLHGDLHSDNILLSQRGWVIIDPKGVIGEREFELGAFLRNPFYDFPKESDVENIERERIAQFADELGFDKKRIRDWAFACAVISLLWFLEDEKYFNEIYVQNALLLDKLQV